MINNRISMEGANGFTTVDTEALLAGEERIIYLEGEINTELAMGLAKQVMYYNLKDTQKPIKLYINSAGGSVTAGLMIYDLLQTSEAPIKVFCLEKAYSMGALLFAAGTHGRYILPHSKVMIHEPLITGGMGGKTSSIQDIADDMMRTKKMLNEILAHHTGKPVQELDEITKNDKFFSADEAVKFGLADKVLGLSDMMAM